MAEIPNRYRKFTEDYPLVAGAYESLGEAVQKAGPLDEKTRAIVKLAISLGARMEGAVHSHTRKALKSGLTPGEIRHAVMLALPTIGLPSTMAGMNWVDDVLEAATNDKPSGAKEKS
ncbi:MAG: carboxymuconolactone decarboxylase family protein [Ignavibacteria bacterium]|nr:carboxymuconolactone decarboxylase family protein [Ignavibacteria bacterium]MCU7503871.1 carboxymuconolactone decarboxylase family protein [Ignavibacteria bacterium]MCU7515908.1 carboxymuconolactone decarboxylase family protein [Ignavibacteria bacterium]